MKALIIVTKNYHEDPHGYDWPDVYTVEADDTEDIRERAAAIMEQLHQNYLDIGKEESSIPVKCELSYCNRETGYGQIVWENEDIHQYFLVENAQKASEVLKEYLACQGKEISEDLEPKGQTSSKTQDTPGSGGQVLSLSTVHVHPDAVDFLSVPMNSDALQVFPNSDQCVLHVADAETVGKYDIPSSVKDCIKYADKRNYSWIHFSYEGEENTHLPTYRTAWDRIM